ncbi:MAG: hypothetical protein ACYC6I_00490 [Bacillota bacterium]
MRTDVAHLITAEAREMIPALTTEKPLPGGRGFVLPFPRLGT